MKCDSVDTHGLVQEFREASSSIITTIGWISLSAILKINNLVILNTHFSSFLKTLQIFLTVDRHEKTILNIRQIIGTYVAVKQRLLFSFKARCKEKYVFLLLRLHLVVKYRRLSGLSKYMALPRPFLYFFKLTIIIVLQTRKRKKT